LVTYRLGVAQSAAEYIKILGSDSVPAPAKMLALSAMVEKNLVDIDILFDAAYALEDQDKSFLMHQFIYLVADRHIEPRCPIGHVDLLGGDSLLPDQGFYRLSGWAIDRAGVARIVLVADGTEVAGLQARAVERPDVVQVFHGFGDEEMRRKSGFVFDIPEGLAAGKTYHVAVRVMNHHFRFRDIFARTLHFLPHKN